MKFLRVSQATDDLMFIIILIVVVLLLAVVIDGLRYGYSKYILKRHHSSELDQDDLINQKTPINIHKALENE